MRSTYVTLVFLFIISDIDAAPLIMKSTTQSNCGELGDCVTLSQNCTDPCGCFKYYYFNESTNECSLNVQYLDQIMTEKYNIQEIIRQEAENVFDGIIISAILFITCAGFAALTACFYCVRLNYSDYKLQQDVKALANKLQRDGKLNKGPKKTTPAVAESCNVVNVDGGVFVC